MFEWWPRSCKAMFCGTLKYSFREIQVWFVYKRIELNKKTFNGIATRQIILIQAFAIGFFDTWLFEAALLNYWLFISGGLSVMKSQIEIKRVQSLKNYLNENCETMRDYARLCETMRVCERLCKTMQGYTRRYKYTWDYSRPYNTCFCIGFLGSCWDFWLLDPI